MKHWVIVLCLAISVFIGGGACQSTGTNQVNGNATANSNASSTPATNTSATPTLDEIRAVLAAHDKALSDKSVDAVMQTFSTDSSTVVLGTGTEERWVGPQEIRAAYTEMFKDYDPGTLQTDCDWRTGGASDNKTMAWLAASCNAKDSLKGKPREYKLNVSGALAKQDGKWRFVLLHMSNAFQPPAATSSR